MIPALVTLWLCVLFLRPRKPWNMAEEMWLCYLREASRYGWMVAGAVALTVMLLIGSVIVHQGPLNHDLLLLRGDGNAHYGGYDIYWKLNDNNEWVMERS